MSSGRLLILAKPQFPHLDNGGKQIDLTGLVQGLNGTPVPSRKPAFQTCQLPPLSPGSQLSFWCLDGTRASLKSLDLLFLAVRSSPISSLFYFKNTKIYLLEVTEEPAWSNRQLQMVLLRAWRKSSQRCRGIGTATGPILPTLLRQTVADSGVLRKFLASGGCQLLHHCILAHLSLRASFLVVGDRLFCF